MNLEQIQEAATRLLDDACCRASIVADVVRISLQPNYGRSIGLKVRDLEELRKEVGASSAKLELDPGYHYDSCSQAADFALILRFGEEEEQPDDGED